MTTRMVSPMPLSDFVPDVTLIAFPISRGGRRTVAEHLPPANSTSLRGQKRIGPGSDSVRANPGANPNSLRLK
jgi:hypothetical protein